VIEMYEIEVTYYGSQCENYKCEDIIVEIDYGEYVDGI